MLDRLLPDAAIAQYRGRIRGHVAEKEPSGGSAAGFGVVLLVP